MQTTWNGHTLALRQETDYPWDGAIRLTVERAPSEPMAIRLRIPAWAVEVASAVNGDAVEATPGSYLVLQRTWSDGDVIDVHLSMAPRLMEGHPRIEETRNQVAVMRGPMVYCLESVDLPEGVDLYDVALPSDMALDARFERDLLGGVVALYGQAVRRTTPSFREGLYAPASPGSGERIGVRLIPYYAWWNRGNARMSVWLPRA